MLNHRSNKYSPYPRVNLPERHWPNTQSTKAPIWCSVDLRAGNQALLEPMCVSEKRRLWNLLISMEIKQIEVGSPATSQADFDFIRELIEQNQIPKDVYIQVYVEPYTAQIVRVFKALSGVERAIIHLVTPSNIIQRERGFGPDLDEVYEMALLGARRIREYAAKSSNVNWQFEYSTESYCSTNPEDAVEMCNAILREWIPTQYPLIINLPTMVERCSPNQFADQVEWFCNHIQHRDKFILSVHTHNDRGCAVAAAEMALLAGADRVEGTILGNGERSGNMDIITLAMNLLSQGLETNLDLHNIQEITQIVSDCTHLPVHPRHPYAGELVFSSSSGAHQTAIKGCMLHHDPSKPWRIPYMPLDPADIGRSYQDVAQVNPNTGQGGICYVLEQYFAMELPRWLTDHFTRLVEQYQEMLDATLDSDMVIDLFRQTYLIKDDYQVHHIDTSKISIGELQLTLATPDGLVKLQGSGNGTLCALQDAWQRWSGLKINIEAYSSHTTARGSDADVVAYIQLSCDHCTVGGVSMGSDIFSTSLHAFIAAAIQGELVAAQA